MFQAKQGDPKRLLRVRFKSRETGKKPNDRALFKGIELHLRIKACGGTSESAVKSQIWSDVCTYVIVGYYEQRLKLEASTHDIRRILSLTPGERLRLLNCLRSRLRDHKRPAASTNLILCE